MVANNHVQAILALELIQQRKHIWVCQPDLRKAGHKPQIVPITCFNVSEIIFKIMRHRLQKERFVGGKRIMLTAIAAMQIAKEDHLAAICEWQHWCCLQHAIQCLVTKFSPILRHKFGN